MGELIKGMKVFLNSASKSSPTSPASACKQLARSNKRIKKEKGCTIQPAFPLLIFGGREGKKRRHDALLSLPLGSSVFSFFDKLTMDCSEHTLYVRDAYKNTEKSIINELQPNFGSRWLDEWIRKNRM